jgi:hypothetical protein
MSHIPCPMSHVPRPMSHVQYIHVPYPVYIYWFIQI